MAGNVSITCAQRVQAQWTGAGFVRWEIWNDTQGIKLYESVNPKLDVYVALPQGTHTLIVQAVGAKDTVLDKHTWDVTN